MQETRTAASVGVHAFLIADVRGYTSFTHTHGDQAASDLARQFAALVTAAVRDHGGELLELRGDEALCVFTSAREAVRASIELQRRLRGPENGAASFPLGVGVGLDAGEAIPTEGGYRGRALNVAARLCARARPGEILASETIATLAGRDEHALFAPRRPVRVKGLDEPVRFVEVVPRVTLPPLPFVPPVRASSQRRRYRLAAALIAAVVVVASLALLILGGTPPRNRGVDVRAHSVAVLDPRTRRVVTDIRFSGSLGAIAADEGAVWVANPVENTIVRIDPTTRRPAETIGLPMAPYGLGVSDDTAWVIGVTANQRAHLLRVRAGTGLVEDLLTLGRSLQVVSQQGGAVLSPTSFHVTADENAIWVVDERMSVVRRIDPKSGDVLATIELGKPQTTDVLGLFSSGALDVAAGADAVWIAYYVGASATNRVLRLDPSENRITARIPFPGKPTNIAAGEGAVWVFDADANAVWRIDPSVEFATERVRIPATAVTGLAAGEGSVWVATAPNRQAAQSSTGRTGIGWIDPQAESFVDSLPLPGRPAIAVGAGYVWLSVH